MAGALRNLRLVAVCIASILAGCAAPPPAGQPASQQPAALKPLAAQPALPAGAAPRSRVPAVRYDLAVSGTGELSPDDEVPGDAPRAETFERGGASWYGIQFHQRRTASGERFDMGAMTAAHRTLPFDTRVCVRSLVNGREVAVRINDRGPYAAGRIIDLSRAAAEQLGMLGVGIKQVALSIMDDASPDCGGSPAAASEPPPAIEAPPRKPAPATKKPARKPVNPRMRR